MSDFITTVENGKLSAEETFQITSNRNNEKTLLKMEEGDQTCMQIENEKEHEKMEVDVQMKEENPKCVLLQSSDKQQFRVRADAAKLSVLVKEQMRKDEEEEEEEEEEVIFLPNVTGTVLMKIIEFMEHHVKEPMKKIAKVKLSFLFFFSFILFSFFY